jgi:hypothetical protein
MGAQFSYRVYEKADRAAVEREWAAAVERDLRENGNSYSGGIGMLQGQIEWRRERFEDRDKASDFLCDTHQKWKPAMAVVCGTGWMIGGWCSS